MIRQGAPVERHEFKPVARELAPAGLRSRPLLAVAAQPSGSKLPRHKSGPRLIPPNSMLRSALLQDCPLRAEH
ncbi:hypothetical protein FHK92_25910 [Pseudomonas brassicacearum subsp. neoaurantiaca]|uniref:Uncharacterized protein n=1 Tax=Pseudomonas brassicacearum subsp. neoaurantiaca TaxID=494916 RepID=A0A7V8UGK6_9PSED|nr:hypothetical protein [Pseudomonas brassicacearum subsp. neoaurantiaca]